MTMACVAFASLPAASVWSACARALEARAPSLRAARVDARADEAACAPLIAAGRLAPSRARVRWLEGAEAAEARRAMEETWVATPFGVARARLVGDALCGFDYRDPPPGTQISAQSAHPLARLFAGKEVEAWFAGSPFGVRVWKALFDVPPGETCSYGALAAALGSAPRAVGGRVGANPISWLAPCHRIVGADGRITGYGGGLTRKRAMLAVEGALARAAYGAGATSREATRPAASMA